MCGRFYVPAQAIDGAIAFLSPELQAQARAAIAEWISDLNRPRNNVSPTQSYPVLTPNGVRPMRWGYITDKSNAVFNAKRESMHYSLWRESLVLRRALVLVGGFYEWTGPKGERQPHAIHRADGNAMALGALFNDDPEAGECFSIVTVPASSWMQQLHHREPLILEPAQAATWLDLTQKPPAIKALLVPTEAPLAEFACPDPRQDRPPRPGAKRDLFSE